LRLNQALFDILVYMRFFIAQILELIAAGMTFDEILADYLYIELADISACLLYASFITNNITIY